MNKLLKIFTYILLIPVVLCLIKYGKSSSLDPEIFIWSWDRLRWLILLLLICIYLIYSLFSHVAIKINAYCFYLIFLMIVGVEVIIRCTPPLFLRN